MFDISKINENEIPSDVIPLKLENKTNEIYIKESNFKNFLNNWESFTFAEGETEYVTIGKQGSDGDTIYKISLYKNKSYVKEVELAHEVFGEYVNMISCKITFDEIVTIKKEFQDYIYCKKYIAPPPTVPTVDKLPTSATLTDAVNKNIEVKDKINACKNKLAYILTNKKLPSTKEEKMTELIDKVNKLDEAPPPIYGVKVMTNNSNPETAVTYIEDAIGIEPAKNENLNGWADKWPFNAVRLVGFKNGQVIKEVSPLYKTKYLDGSTVPADVDVMSEIPKIYWKVNTITDGYEIRISDKQVDTDYKCLAHLVGGVEKDFIYVGAYLGYVEGGKLRSKSGVSPTALTTLTEFRQYAQAVGSGYQLDNWYPLVLRKILYLIAYKNLDSQTALGKGNTNSSKKNTGGTNTRGLYYGSTSATEQVCFLGVEDFYGNLYTWVDGMYYNGNIMVTPDNKSFNNSASVFKNVGSTSNSGTYGHIKNVVKTTEGLFFPSDFGGSSSTYYSDSGIVYSDSFSTHGGNYNDGANAGAFLLSVSYSDSQSYLNFGGRLVYMG